MSENYLVIPDLQIPFEAKNALSFATSVKKHYGIKDEHCLCVGDEIDAVHGSLFAKNPDARHSPITELEDTLERLKQWYAAFPKMKVAVSNHGLRYWKRASDAGIPSRVLRTYKETLEAPKDWYWQDSWIIQASRRPFMMVHGMEYGGQTPYRMAPLIEGMSVVHGHLHSSAGIAYIRTKTQNLWGFNVGSLIDPDAYAFQYSKYSRFKANLGIGVIANGGTTPLWIPYE